MENSKPLAYLVILIGLAAVLLARGCDTTGARSAMRLDAKLDLERQEFERDWDRKLAEVDEGDWDERQELMEEKEEEAEELREGLWQKLEERRDRAQAKYRVNGYWRAWLFVLGTIVLSLGLMYVGLAGQGAERWVCMIGVFIILISIYIGGMAWLNSLPFR